MSIAYNLLRRLFLKRKIYFNRNIFQLALEIGHRNQSTDSYFNHLTSLSVFYSTAQRDENWKRIRMSYFDSYTFTLFLIAGKDDAL